MRPGNSGGPWITRSGRVVALDESGPPYDEDDERAQGNNGGVPASQAVSHITAWRAAPEPEANRGCQPSSPREAAEQTLQLYFYAIDKSDYATAYGQLWSQDHPISGLSGFIDGVQSSTDEAPDGDGYYEIAGAGRTNGNVYIDAVFRSLQHAAQGRNNQTCTDWTLRYVFSSYYGLQLIHYTPATPGTRGNTAC